MKKQKTIIFAGMGFELVGLILGGLYFGSYLDKTYNLQGLATAGMAFIVMISWVWHLIVLVKKFQNAPEDSN